VHGILKKVPNGVLVLKASSTYPLGMERVLARLGWAGEILTPAVLSAPVALLIRLF